jgi:hypothetical protein
MGSYIHSPTDVSPTSYLLGGPLGKAVLGGVAAFAMKKMMDNR